MGLYPEADNDDEGLHYPLLARPAEELYIPREVLTQDLVIQAEDTLSLIQGLQSPPERQGLTGSCKDQSEYAITVAMTTAFTSSRE